MKSKTMIAIENFFKRWNFQDRLKAPSAGALILREVDGELKVALAQHKNKTWVMPKGHVEPGETIEQAALREIQEETGLSRVQLIQYLGVVVRGGMKSNGTLRRKTIHYYLAYAFHADQASKPSDNAFIKPGWFTPQEAIELLAHEEERSFFREHLDALLQ